jgi:hypothetical protein
MHCPHWRPHIFLFFQRDDVHSDGEGDVQNLHAQGMPTMLHDQMLSVDHAISAAGGLHVMHNSTEGMFMSMQNFEAVQKHINALAKFLNNKWCREKYVATCLVGPWAAWAHLLDQRSPTLVGWRWGSLCSVVESLLDREPLLRQTWDATKIKHAAFGGHAPQNPGDIATREFLGSSLSDANDAIQSPLMWAYVRMLSHIVSIIDHMTHWHESCSCHSSYAGAGNLTPEQHRAAFNKRLGTTGLGCPMKGRRAAELAAGDFDHFIDELLGITQGQVLFHCREGLAPAELQTLLIDFESARQHLILQLRTKFSVWRRLPHVLCGVAHHVNDKARAVARFAVQQHQRLGADNNIHPMTYKFMSPGPLRQELLEFIDGVDLSTLPLLRDQVVRFKIMPTSERSAEAPHALIHREILHGRHAGPAFLSCKLRTKDIEKTMALDTEFLKSLARNCVQIYHPIRAAQVLGIAGHPTLATDVRHTFFENMDGVTSQLLGPGHHLESETKDVVYHVDLQSRFVDMSSIHKRPDSGKLVEVDASNLKAKYALDLFRSRVETSTFLSFPKHGQVQMDGRLPEALSLTSLFETLIPPSSSMPTDDMHEFAFEFDACDGSHEGSSSCAILHRPDCPPSDLESPIIFVRTVHAQPTALNVGRSDAKVKLTTRDIAVCKHDVMDVDRLKNEVTVSLEAARARSNLASMHEDTVFLLNDVDFSKTLVWTEASGGLHVQWVGLPHGMNLDIATTVAKHIATACAFPNSVLAYTPHDNDDARLQSMCEVLQQLATADLVVEGLVSAGTWQFTSFGLANVKLGMALCKPQYMLRTIITNVDELSVYELLVNVEAKGWQHEEWPRRQRKPPPIPVPCPIDFVKTYYTRAEAITVSRSYLIVLARLGDVAFCELMKAKQVSAVAHLGEEKYYKALLADHRANRSDKFEFDVEDDIGMYASSSLHGPRTKNMAASLLHAESFRWGCCVFTFRPPTRTAPPRYQVVCPRRSHVKHLTTKSGRASMTMCTKTLPFHTSAEKDLVVLRLKHWLSKCTNYHSKTAHQKFHALVDVLPSAVEIDESVNCVPANRELTDDEGIGGAPPRKRGRRAAGSGAASSHAAANRDSSSSSSSSSSSNCSSGEHACSSSSARDDEDDVNLW